MKMFTSLEEIKSVAEKFHCGKIVPRRVIKIEGKHEKNARSDLIFKANLYRVLGVNNVHVFLCDFKEDIGAKDHFIELKGTHRNLNLNGSAYGKSGNHFIGNYEIGDEECLRLFNQAVFGKTAIEL